METTLATNQTASFIYASDRVFLRNIDSGIQPLQVCVWKGNLYAYFYKVYPYAYLQVLFQNDCVNGILCFEVDAPPSTS